MRLSVSKEVVVNNLYTEIVLGRALFAAIIGQYGKAAWNAYSDRLRLHNVWAMYSSPDDRAANCMPICLKIDLRGEKFWRCDLSELDLRVPAFTGADFTKANLSGSTCSSVAHAVFHGTDLSDADLRLADISGADFLDANTNGAMFERACYLPDDPPRNLSQESFKKCRPFPPDWGNVSKSSETVIECKEEVRSCALKSFWGALPHTEDANDKKEPQRS